nr:hypothetical protein [uncultured Caldimonas sp.]
MGTPHTFRDWLQGHAETRPGLRPVALLVGQDEAAAALSDSLSQWQLHYAARGASFEVLEALRVAWWDYIQCRAANAVLEPAAKRRMRTLERRLQSLAPSLP